MEATQRIITEDMFDEEIFSLVYEQAQEDAEAEYGPCSVNMYSPKWSSVDNNLVTLRNGNSTICQYNITKNGELRRVRN